jgi:hypothetical protein
MPLAAIVRAMLLGFSLAFAQELHPRSVDQRIQATHQNSPARKPASMDQVVLTIDARALWADFIGPGLPLFKVGTQLASIHASDLHELHGTYINSIAVQLSNWKAEGNAMLPSRIFT